MKYGLLGLLLLAGQVFADSNIPPGQWQCMAVDRTDHAYAAVGLSLKEAMHAAKKRCVQESKRASTCKTAESYCEQGPLSLIEDRCLVSDEEGHTWDATGMDSCKTAMALCNEWQFLNGISSSQCIVRHR